MAVSDPREVGPARQPGDHRGGDEEPRHGGPVGARGPEAGDRLHRSRDAEGRDTGVDFYGDSFQHRNDLVCNYQQALYFDFLHSGTPGLVSPD